MAIPPAHAHRHAYHFTHFENLPQVLAHGFLSCHEQVRRGLRHTSIAEASIQARRSTMSVTCRPGGVVHDYVPLYFGSLSPMLLSLLNTRNVDQQLLVYFAFPISILDRPTAAFTDAAANSDIPPRFFDDPAHLDQLNWNAIDSTRWGSGDHKHARMAECLVHTRLDPREAAFLVVWNESMRKNVEEVYAAAGAPTPPIFYDRQRGSFFFSHFLAKLPEDMRGHPLGPGPIATKHRYEQALAEIRATRGAVSTAHFASVSALLEAFRSGGLTVLPETRELIGLESENEVHSEDVGAHTLSVVKALRGSREFNALSHGDQALTEIAAYLHDIGKGPKSRWARCEGRQQVDAAHPLRSVDMLRRILVEEVGVLDDESARSICMLVAYHDLIGDIVGKGRRKQQMLDVVRDKRDFDMLVAIGLADVAAIGSIWAAQVSDAIPGLLAWLRGQVAGFGG